jgi:hypothetical protein
LGQTGTQDLEGAAGVSGAVHHQARVDREALLVLGGRDEPGGMGVQGMEDDPKAKAGGLDLVQLAPMSAAAVAEKDPVVVLPPSSRRGSLTPKRPRSRTPHR